MPVIGGGISSKGGKWGSSLLFRTSTSSGSSSSGGGGRSSNSNRRSQAAQPRGRRRGDNPADPALANDELNFDDGDDDDDPLLSLFRVHNTNRVRFDLTPPSATTSTTTTPSSSSTTQVEVGSASSSSSSVSSYINNANINSTTTPHYLPTTIQDKFKNLMVRSNSTNNDEHNAITTTALPPSLLKKSTSNLKPKPPSSMKGIRGSTTTTTTTTSGKHNNILGMGKANNTGHVGGRTKTADSDDDDLEDAYIKKMLEPTPIRRISSFLSGGGGSGHIYGGGGSSSGSSSGKLNKKAATATTTASVGSSREHHGLKHQSLSSLDYDEDGEDNDDTTTTNNYPTIESSSLSYHSSNNNNNNSPGKHGSGSKSNGNTTQQQQPQLRQRHHSLFRSTKKYNDTIATLLKKARYAHKHSFRYHLAMRYYLLALKELTSTLGYSDTTDPLTAHVLKSLNDVHHAQVTLSNSSNIVQMGIDHEDTNQLIKALRMYTIAYRMRRDALGVDHPSLAVLLNMMGGVQMKRREYDEAMRLYELSLHGRMDENGGKGRDVVEFRRRNPLTTSVTLRDMGMILERKRREEKALVLYHASLRYAVQFIDGNNGQPSQERKGGNVASSKVGSNIGNLLRKAAAPQSVFGGSSSTTVKDDDDWLENFDNCHVDSLFSLEEVRLAKSSTTTTSGKVGKAASASEVAAGNNSANGDADTENGEMEVFLEKRFDKWASTEDIAQGGGDATTLYYDGLCLPPAENGTIPSENGKEEAYFDIALTLHQIGQIHRRSHRYNAALSAYNASLRGMKQVLGTQHGIIAAILGNIGNLNMEIGNLDEAFNIYQEVLGIETTLLGLSHPEVAVTLHNIATIECSRGNFSDGASLFKQVVDMQKIRYGNEHLTVAVTLSCLADAYEKLKNVNGAIKTYEEALKIRKSILGESHLDVGRLMHKIGRLLSSRKEYATAEIYMKRASEIYNANKLKPDHVFLREMDRDCADIQAQLALGKK